MEESRRISVLVVDDDRITKELLMSILRNDGYLVVGEASNGAEAVKQYRELKPDIVLLDISMPQMDGLQALEEIRKSNPSALVLFISAHFTTEKINEAIQKGAAGFVAKPFKPANVLDKLSTCWHGRNNVASKPALRESVTLPPL